VKSAGGDRPLDSLSPKEGQRTVSATAEHHEIGMMLNFTVAPTGDPR
jgi:hypothetical protein